MAGVGCGGLSCGGVAVLSRMVIWWGPLLEMMRGLAFGVADYVAAAGFRLHFPWDPDERHGGGWLCGVSNPVSVVVNRQSGGLAGMS